MKRSVPVHKSDRKDRKKARFDLPSNPVSGKFLNPDDIRTALQSNEVEVLTHALTTLRNQLTIRFDEDALLPQDERLLLAKSWLEKSPGAQDVFSIVGKASKKISSLCFAVLSALLNLLSVHFIYHPFGETVVKTLLSSSHIRLLNTSLNDTNSSLILSTLQLFNAMSNFAGGVEKRSVMDGFAWGQKSLNKLLFLRRKDKGAEETKTLGQPDIRTLYISFILSFLSNTTPTPIKLSLLEQHRDVFLLVFKGISQDPYTLVRHILEVCWEGVWNDHKIKRTLKVGLFNELTFNHLLKLYGRDAPEDKTADHVPADLIHHFMLAVMARPGVGICFKSRGWYPRDNTLEETTKKTTDLDEVDHANGQGGKIYNKILGNIVKSLKVNEDARQQELAFKILQACPELVAGYWGAANLTLEPRLSSRWITNISVLGTIISFPTPASSFLLPQSTHHNPSPPPLSSMTANVLPSVLNKTHLTKGLQSSSGLVQHCTALTLSKCLTKLDNVLRTFREIARKLEEDDATGQWLKRSRELEIEVERRVPDFMVVIAMVQQKHSIGSREQCNPQAALLTESALRLLWLYHKLFPRLVSEVRFDVGKLLLGVFDPTLGSTDSSDTNADSFLTQKNQKGLDVLRQLHVVHLLKESDQFVWSSKSGAFSHSHLHAIFTLYTKTSHLAVKDATSDLLTHVLSSSILFSHDPPELDLWLSALPLTRRAVDATAPDGTPLTDEGTGVLAFLDDCIQRFLKTPYRYLEDGLAFFNESIHLQDEAFMRDDPGMSPSPLLMTVLEQLRAKSAASLLSPSDILAVGTFIRKLACGLTTKMRSFQRVWAIASKIEEILSAPVVAPQSAIMQKAIKRESDFLSRTLQFILDPHSQCPTSTSPAVQDFLKQVESLPIPSSEAAASSAAYELVDWMRIIDMPLHHTEANRVLDVIIRFSPPAATELLYQLDPQFGHMWSDSDDRVKVLEDSLSFEWAYLHSTPEQLMKKHVKDSLVSLFFSKTAWNSSLERRVSFSIHRLAASNGRDRTSPSLRHAELSLLGSIMHRGRSQRGTVDLSRLKHALFQESDAIRELCCSRDLSTIELTELSHLVRVSLQCQVKSDHELALAYCNFWMVEAMTESSLRTCTLASPWIPFMESMAVNKHLDIVIGVLEGGYLLSDAEQTTVNIVLGTLVRLSTKAQLTELHRRIRGLIAIRPFLHHKAILDTLLLLIIDARLPLGCNSLPLTLEQSRKVSDITFSAQERWNIHSARLPLDSAIISTLLSFEDWDETIARIISGSIYTSSAPRRDFRAWLFKTDPSQASSLAFVIIPLHAYLDVMMLRSEDGMNQIPDAWFSAVVQCLFRAETSDDLHILCASCIWLLFQGSTSRREHYVTYLLREVQDETGTFLNRHCVRLFRDLHRLDVTALSPVLLEVIDRALKWMVHQFSGNEISEEDITVLDEMSQLVSCMETKAHLVEPVLKAAIQSCLHMPTVITSLASLVSSAHLKPASVNRQLQSIVQHSQLYRITDPSLPSRQPVIQLLRTLFYIHPTNTCQPSHIAPLMRLYGGTLSLSDRLLFSIFYLYENQRKESVASMFRNWCSTPSAPPSQDFVGAIISLDPPRVFRTCTAFPTWRRLDGSGLENVSMVGNGLYDPVFLTLLVGQVVMEHKTLSATEWVQMFRSNIISLVTCVLTSRNEDFRRLGRTIMAAVLKRVQEADFLERGQVIYIMDILRDLLPPHSFTLSTPRLPTHSTILLAHALHAVFYPSSFLYPIVSRFLLQRPELDTTDVPMLYSLLYSSEDGEWTRERTWMIRFLCEAMNDGSAQDWTALRRRHTWDLVASMWQATRPEERSLRKGVLEFLANLSSNQHAISSLILRSSLLTWIEMQLETGLPNEEESIAWVKILENIIVTAKVGKIGKVTRGEFSAALARCLCLLLRAVTVSETLDTLATQIGILQLISRVLLRIATDPLSHNIILADLLQQASQVLQSFEPWILWTDKGKVWKVCDAATAAGPPHRARGLFDIIGATEDTTSSIGYELRVWAEIVATLWRVVMVLGKPNLPIDVGAWDTLTCRLLLLQALPWFHSQSRNDTNIEEWARRETLMCHLQVDVEEEETGLEKA